MHKWKIHLLPIRFNKHIFRLQSEFQRAFEHQNMYEKLYRLKLEDLLQYSKHGQLIQTQLSDNQIPFQHDHAIIAMLRLTNERKVKIKCMSEEIFVQLFGGMFILMV